MNDQSKIFVVLVIVFLLLGLNVSAQTAKSVSYGILFDNTGSMRRQLAKQQEIATLILNRVPKDSKISIYGFATVSPISSFATGLECSKDIPTIQSKILGISVVGGQTTLLDAIRSGAERLKTPVKTECGSSDEQVLIIMSDGEDRASTINPEALITALNATGVKVYIIGFLVDLSDSGFISKSSVKKAKELLIKIAKENGGRVVFVDKKQTSEELVTKLFAENYSFPK